MKHLVKKILQKILGMQGYLFVFSIFVIVKLKWDKNERDFLTFLKLIPNNGIILDVGANIGVMTWYLSRRKKDATILSFEPIPFNFKVLQRITKLFRLKNVKLRKMAVGERHDTVDMLIPKIESVTMHGLCHIKDIDEGNEWQGETVPTKMIVLDKFADIIDTNKKVVAIKLDVENYEYNVLKGAMNILENHRPIIYTELWQNENRSQCINLIEKLNYKVFIFVKNKTTIFNESIAEGQNFLFVPAEKEMSI